MLRRILIAEDEPYIVESLTFLLSREGHQVTAVGDGAAVLPAITRSRPDLLILDIMLPTANGFEILAEIRHNMALKTLPVMVLTAKGQDADRRRMTDLGVDDFVTKPFSNHDLVTRVARLLEAPRRMTSGGR
ncbi:MAG TPA: response regulator [Ferrovibrio sp.]|uniref:response regulator transcription factor n=1 Tax=Ferrovibrio sp. TaxID=1917215 RepID=UPI002B4B93DF|nr:response regulator [Ferrovibrio sp.]HLT77540.1 response regulator [Ferrovibrio sp.]